MSEPIHHSTHLPYAFMGHETPTTGAREFFRALAHRLTYSPLRNSDVIFGFLWGVPIPVFAFLIHFHASGAAPGFGAAAKVLAENPAYIIFLLHPFLFAAVFGALGTMRAERDDRIGVLMKFAEDRCQELKTANEGLKELDNLKSEFLANVTHELKSPLVAALGYTDRMLGAHLGGISEKQKHALEVSKRNLIRLRGLIDEILDFSRLDARATSFQIINANLGEVVLAAVESLALKARERNINIDFSMPATPAMVQGDPNKLSQVALNLLDNAIKFSPPDSSVALHIARDESRWRLTISDNGPGIPPEALPKLFNRFFQADGSRARAYNGVGLGLAIVKKIVDAHHGRVWVESQIGHGTSVHVLLNAMPEPRRTGSTEKHSMEVKHAANSAY